MYGNGIGIGIDIAIDICIAIDIDICIGMSNLLSRHYDDTDCIRNCKKKLETICSCSSSSSSSRPCSGSSIYWIVEEWI